MILGRQEREVGGGAKEVVERVNLSSSSLAGIRITRDPDEVAPQLPCPTKLVDSVMDVNEESIEISCECTGSV